MNGTWESSRGIHFSASPPRRPSIDQLWTPHKGVRFSNGTLHVADFVTSTGRQAPTRPTTYKKQEYKTQEVTATPTGIASSAFVGPDAIRILRDHQKRKAAEKEAAERQAVEKQESMVTPIGISSSAFVGSDAIRSLRDQQKRKAAEKRAAEKQAAEKRAAEKQAAEEAAAAAFRRRVATPEPVLKPVAKPAVSRAVLLQAAATATPRAPAAVPRGTVPNSPVITQPSKSTTEPHVLEPVPTKIMVVKETASNSAAPVTTHHVLEVTQPSEHVTKPLIAERIVTDTTATMTESLRVGDHVSPEPPKLHVAALDATVRQVDRDSLPHQKQPDLASSDDPSITRQSSVTVPSVGRLQAQLDADIKAAEVAFKIDTPTVTSVSARMQDLEDALQEINSHRIQLESLERNVQEFRTKLQTLTERVTRILAESKEDLQGGVHDGYTGRKPQDVAERHSRLREQEQKVSDAEASARTTSESLISELAEGELDRQRGTEVAHGFSETRAAIIERRKKQREEVESLRIAEALEREAQRKLDEKEHRAHVRSSYASFRAVFERNYKRNQEISSLLHDLAIHPNITEARRSKYKGFMADWDYYAVATSFAGHDARRLVRISKYMASDDCPEYSRYATWNERAEIPWKDFAAVVEETTHIAGWLAAEADTFPMKYQSTVRTIKQKAEARRNVMYAILAMRANLRVPKRLSPHGPLENPVAYRAVVDVLTPLRTFLVTVKVTVGLMERYLTEARDEYGPRMHQWPSFARIIQWHLIQMRASRYELLDDVDDLTRMVWLRCAEEERNGKVLERQVDWGVTGSSLFEMSEYPEVHSREGARCGGGRKRGPATRTPLKANARIIGGPWKTPTIESRTRVRRLVRVPQQQAPRKRVAEGSPRMSPLLFQGTKTLRLGERSAQVEQKVQPFAVRQTLWGPRETLSKYQDVSKPKHPSGSRMHLPGKPVRASKTEPVVETAKQGSESEKKAEKMLRRKPREGEIERGREKKEDRVEVKRKDRRKRREKKKAALAGISLANGEGRRQGNGRGRTMVLRLSPTKPLASPYHLRPEIDEPTSHIVEPTDRPRQVAGSPQDTEWAIAAESTSPISSAATSCDSATKSDSREDNSNDNPVVDAHATLSYRIPSDVMEQAIAKIDNGAFWSYDLYRGPDGEAPRLHYCRSKETAEGVAKLFQHDRLLGFDLEWVPDSLPHHGAKKNVALIQLANESRIALFHVSLFKGNSVEELMPPTLKAILQSSGVSKAGVAILADCTRLRKFLGVQVQGIVELSHLFRLVKYSSTNLKLVNRRLVSLAVQVEEHLQLPLYKGEVRGSDWSLELSREQQIYAASDAYAAVHLYDVMEQKRKQIIPMPPQPAHAELKLPISSGNDASAVESKQAECREEDAVADAEEVQPARSDADELGQNSQPTITYPELPSIDDPPSSETSWHYNTTGKQSRTPSAESAEDASSSRSVAPPQEVDLHLANAWVASYVSALPHKPRVAHQHLLAYTLWHHYMLDISGVASSARDPPLRPDTAACFVLDAIRLEGLPFERSRVAHVLDHLPEGLRDKRFGGIAKQAGI